jgi:hypothetical protein
LAPIKNDTWLPYQLWEITGVLSFEFTEETAGNTELEATKNVMNEISIVLERLCNEQLIRITNPDIIVGRAAKIDGKMGK